MVMGIKQPGLLSTPRAPARAIPSSIVTRFPRIGPENEPVASARRSVSSAE